MIDSDLNLLPKSSQRVTFHGTARCSEASPQCISVGTVVDTGDLVLADVDGQTFKVPAAEKLAVFTLIAQSLRQ